MFKLSYYVFGFENKYCCLFLINKGTLLYDQPSYIVIQLRNLRWERAWFFLEERGTETYVFNLQEIEYAANSGGAWRKEHP